MDVKCSECGFLTIWLRLQNQLDEASEMFRHQGHLEAVQNDESFFHIKCFTRQHDLARESTVPVDLTSKYNKRVLDVINKPRRCNGYIKWMQGFHPKEHIEMLLNEDMLIAQRKHANISLAVAVLAVWWARFPCWWGRPSPIVLPLLELKRL